MVLYLRYIGITGERNRVYRYPTTPTTPSPLAGPDNCHQIFPNNYLEQYISQLHKIKFYQTKPDLQEQLRDFLLKFYLTFCGKRYTVIF